MAIMVVTAARVEISSVDYTAAGFAKQAELSMESAQIGDVATFGAGWEAFLAGLKSATLTVTLNQDFAATTVDDRLWALFSAGAAVAFKIRPTTAAIGTGNPEYSGQVVPVSYSPISAKVGDLAVVQFTWPVTGAITRATS